MKISDLLNPMMSSSFAALSQKEVDVKTAFTIAQIMEERKQHLTVFEAARKSLIERFASKDEKGQPLLNEEKTEFVIEDRAGYDKEYNELVDLDIIMSTIDQSAVEKMNSITAAQVLALKPFLK